MNDLEKILESCIVKRQKTGSSVENVLKDCSPEEVEEIRSLLELSEKLASLPDPVTSLGTPFKIMAKVIAEQKKNDDNKLRLRWTKRILKLAAGFVIIFSIGLGSVYASSRSLPGDFLYPLKRFTEKVQFFLTSTDKNKAELRLVFSDKRLAEAIKKHRKDKVIDTVLLNDMLNEARNALMYSSKLDVKDKRTIIFLLDSTTLNQRNKIEDLYQRVPATERKELAPYLCACNHRCEMIKNIMTDIGIKPACNAKKCDISNSSIQCGCKKGKMCKKSQKETNAWKKLYPSK